MIDFQSGGLFARLGPSDPSAIAAELAPIFVNGEAVHLDFKGQVDIRSIGAAHRQLHPLIAPR